MNALAMLKALDMVLAGISLLETMGINYREVIDAQEQAALEGRDLTEAERQNFVDQAQDAIDKL